MKSIRINGSLVLKEINESSARDIFHLIDNNHSHLREWLPFIDNTKRPEDTEQFIRWVRKSDRDLVFEIRENNEIIGLIALKDIDYLNCKTEIGYWLTKDHEGKGIITRSCEALLDICFKEMGMNRVQIKAATGNAKSLLVSERLGLKFEGIERAGEYLNGRFADLMVFSILKNEWKGLKRS